jgi:hypothetical protein
MFGRLPKRGVIIIAIAIDVHKEIRKMFQRETGPFWRTGFGLEQITFSWTVQLVFHLFTY